VSDAAPGAPGFFGKVRTEGDFVRRRLPGHLLFPFEAWLSTGLLASRAALGDGWLAAYLTAPIWRFAFSGGVCGAWPAVGLLMPSVDSVGRHFPLVVVASLPCGTPAVATALSGEWWAQVEALALTCLDADLDLGSFDSRLATLAPPLLERSAKGSLRAGLRVTQRADQTAGALAAMLDALGEASLGAHSLWWRAASDAVEWRLHAGLPEPSLFAEFLGDPAGDGLCA
jgi:type VI secretion system protein ImpM